MEAASKLMRLYKSEKDDKKKELFKKDLSECIADAGILRVASNEQKENIKKILKSLVRPSYYPCGVKILGPHYMFAYRLYK